MRSGLLRLGLVSVLAFMLLIVLPGAAWAGAPEVTYTLSAPGNTTPPMSLPWAPFQWYNVPVKLTFGQVGFDDPIEGMRFNISSAWYTRDNGPQVAIVPTSTVTVSADGLYLISCQGLGGPIGSVWVGIDGTPPVSTLCAIALGPTPTPLPTSSGRCWARTNVWVSGIGNDGTYGSGPATTTCCADSHSSYSYDTTFTLSTEGVHSVAFSAWDVAGNHEATRICMIGIDKTAPVLAVAAARNYNGPATIVANASDTLSGVGRVEMSIDTTANWQTTGQITATAIGSHIAYSRAYDVAGNLSEASTASFIVRPAVKTKTLLVSSSNVRAKRSLKLSGTISPSAGPGTMAIIKNRLIGKKWRSAGLAVVNVARGKYSYKFKPTARGQWRFTASYSGGIGGTTTYLPSRSRVKAVDVK